MFTKWCVLSYLPLITQIFTVIGICPLQGLCCLQISDANAILNYYIDKFKPGFTAVGGT